MKVVANRGHFHDDASDFCCDWPAGALWLLFVRVLRRRLYASGRGFGQRTSLRKTRRVAQGLHEHHGQGVWLDRRRYGRGCRLRKPVRSLPAAGRRVFAVRGFGHHAMAVEPLQGLPRGEGAGSFSREDFMSGLVKPGVPGSCCPGGLARPSEPAGRRRALDGREEHSCRHRIGRLGAGLARGIPEARRPG